jgi:hypothetical protein
MPANAVADAHLTRIARQIVRDGARVIGFLTVTGRRDPVDLTPLLQRIAQSVTGFVEQRDVAVIPTWGEWKPLAGGSPETEAAPRMTVREVQPRVVEVLPAAKSDATSAGMALGEVLKVLSDDFAHVLINLDGYAPPGGRAPSAVALVEAVALVVSRRRARLKDVGLLIEHIPTSKHLGAVLLG